MPEFLETTVEKFTFRVADDRYYSPEGVWVLLVAGRVQIGLSDFVQQRSGDVAFAEIKPVGTKLSAGDEIAVIETIKVNISFSAPVSGTIVEINPAMEDAPEAINQDPYGEGWMVILEPENWEPEQANLYSPQMYFERMKREAEEESKKQ